MVCILVQNNKVHSEVIVMRDLIRAFDAKLCFQKRYCYKKLQVLSNLEKNNKDLDIHEKLDEEKVIEEIISVIDSSIKKFLMRCSQFKQLSETLKLIMHPVCDVTLFDGLNLSQFDWLESKNFEMQLIDFQFSSIWIQRFIEKRKNLELMYNKNYSNEN
ncbi:general transcription factor II-I repeat domain-containing protein 2A [Trichonephila clavipes]|nr:general transcription factor II-I repeat domain-containing protein 2A [Trichonephila clavipes]